MQKTMSMAVALLALAVLAMGSRARAADEAFWVKSVPTIEELTGGMIKTGDTISAENVEVVKDLMSESMYRNTLDGAVWKINPTTPTSKLLIPDLIRATRENQGKARVTENGTVTTTEGEPWIGGFPVPEPRTAIEVMANRHYYDVDAHIDGATGYWVNPAGEVYKTIGFRFQTYYMTGRVCEDPKPVVPGFGDELRRELLLDLDPYDVRGLSVLTILYNDQTKYPDSWGYVPVLRRVQRFSSGQRYDSLDGSDLRAGDIGAFSDPLALWDFKLIARQPFLSMVTVDNPIPESDKTVPLIKGKYPRDAKLEVRDTFILETVPKDSGHIYSRKRLYIDAGIYYAWLGDFYDKQDKLWLGWHTLYVRGESRCGNYPRAIMYRLYNFQTGGGTHYDVYLREYAPGDKLTPDHFTLKYLMSQGR